MKILNLNLIKQNSRIQGTLEDKLLEAYGDSAEQTICAMLNRGVTVDDMVGNLTEQYGEVPADIVHAALMLVDTSYKHRTSAEPLQMNVVPYGNIDIKLRPYIVLTTSEEE